MEQKDDLFLVRSNLGVREKALPPVYNITAVYNKQNTFLLYLLLCLATCSKLLTQFFSAKLIILLDRESNEPPHLNRFELR